MQVDDEGNEGTVRWPARLAGVLIAVALVAIGGRIEVPMVPVPMTLQSLCLIVVGGVLGPWLGGVAMLAYLALGSVGLPVFAGGGSGTEALFGPTAGYLLSFPLCAALAGFSTYTTKTNRLALTACFLGAHLVLLALGSAWLGHHLDLDAARALESGFTPFLPGALVKSAVGALAVAHFLRHRMPAAPNDRHATWL